MRKAYDNILQDYIDAETASKNGGFEPYRYECACCWEEVHICAADSKIQATHFRHRNGNSNIDCENYLGNRSVIIHNALTQRNDRQKIEFYFSSTTKLFSIGVKFNANEIVDADKSRVYFQVKTSSKGKASISIPISSGRFLPDVTEFIPLNEFSWEYFTSSSYNSKQLRYEVFRKDIDGSLYPSFFKIQTGDGESGFRAKLIRSDILYTQTPYIIVFPHQYPKLNFQSDVILGDFMQFQTIGRSFTAANILFTTKSMQVEQQLSAWKYRLESNETLTLLWPPSTQVNDSIEINSASAFIYSTFELQAHGNINVLPQNIYPLDNGLSKITIAERTKIYKKNAEMVIVSREYPITEYNHIDIKNNTLKKYKAYDDNAFLFSKNGVTKLSEGTTLFITRSCIVRHYSYGYLDGLVIAPEQYTGFTGRDLIEDIIKNYKRMEKFTWTDFEHLDLSDDAFTYIESCETTGIINSAVKRFIEEGRI